MQLLQKLLGTKFDRKKTHTLIFTLIKKEHMQLLQKLLGTKFDRKKTHTLMFKICMLYPRMN